MPIYHPESLLIDTRHKKLVNEYHRYVDQARLASPSEQLRALASTNATSGIYVWTVRTGVEGTDEHVIYVGRTNLLARRVKEYLRGFQPHSVNDYKLQIFQEFLLRIDAHAVFMLYFKQEPTESLIASEKAAISAFNPLLNQKLGLLVPTEAQVEFRNAFERYYAAGFSRFVVENVEA